MSLPLNIDFQQILLHAFNLVLLFGGLYLLLYKPVKKFIDERADRYAQIENQTKENLERAKQEKDLAAEKLSGAEAEISALKAQARLKAEQEADSIIKEARETKKKILADAEDAAIREKNRIINDAREEIAELAVKAAEKVLMEKAVKSDDTDA